MLRLLRFGVVIVISSILSLVVVALTKNERSRMKGLRLLGFQQGFLDGFSKRLKMASARVAKVSLWVP